MHLDGSQHERQTPGQHDNGEDRHREDETLGGSLELDPVNGQFKRNEQSEDSADPLQRQETSSVQVLARVPKCQATQDGGKDEGNGAPEDRPEERIAEAVHPVRVCMVGAGEEIR